MKFIFEKINFISSNQRVIFFPLHRYECFEKKKKQDEKQRMSDIFTHIPDVVSYGKYELPIFR